MSKRGSVGVFVLVSILVVALVGAFYLVSGQSPPTGMVYLSRDIIMPSIVNPYGNQFVELPYSIRGMSHQYVYAQSYGLKGNPRVTMRDCQTYCFGRPDGIPDMRYPKIEYGGKMLRGCVAECNEQRLGITDTTVHDYHHDKLRFDRPLFIGMENR